MVWMLWIIWMLTKALELWQMLISLGNLPRTEVSFINHQFMAHVQNRICLFPIKEACEELCPLQSNTSTDCQTHKTMQLKVRAKPANTILIYMFIIFNRELYSILNLSALHVEKCMVLIKIFSSYSETCTGFHTKPHQQKPHMVFEKSDERRSLHRLLCMGTLLKCWP